MAKSGICILGIYVADLAFTAKRQPLMGETILGTRFAIGPGGKGSNQAVAAARAGGSICFISKLGQDNFGDAAIAMYQKEGIAFRGGQIAEASTGAAYIFLEEGTGSNAIIVVPGAAGRLGLADVEEHRDAIESAQVFMTQLEQPIPAARRALEIAKSAGTLTILNPAPAARLDDSIYPLCDFVTPNESEAESLTGIAVKDLDSARRAADVLLQKGAGIAVITMGSQGALLRSRSETIHIPVFEAGPVVDTTGAGDAFNGGFAAALAEGKPPKEAAYFGSATAGLSVTRPGTAPSMPARSEIEMLLKRA